MNTTKKNEKSNKTKKIWFILCQVMIFLFILLEMSLRWEWNNFGGVDISGIIFTLTMPLEGTSGSFVESYLLKALLPTVIIFFAEIIVLKLAKKYLVPIIIDKTFCSEKIFRLTPLKTIVFVIAMLAASYAVADYHLKITPFIMNQVDESEFIKTNYVKPNQNILEFPKNKRNLVYIFVESAETTLQNKGEGGEFKENYIPEMTLIEEKNVSFSQNNRFKGAYVTEGGGWTVGGMFSEWTGVPLKLPINGNGMYKFRDFLPGVISLPDLLKKEGYYNYFMCGSELAFGGRDHFLKQHGEFDYLDYKKAIKEKKISKDYFKWWGFEDSKLYSYAKEKLLELSKGDKPFNFSMLTADTHHIGGFVCDMCENKYEDQYANVWSCASKQLENFMEWMKKQNFYKNTTIVICGDHCSMDPDFYKKHNIKFEQRRVYNAFINSAVKPQNEKNRRFTTLDIFPSTLAAMGVKIKGNQLGLGVNLFSNKKTLSEKYGYSKIDTELKKKSTFYEENYDLH